MARPLIYRYRHLAQQGYDCAPTIEAFAGSLLDEFEAAISENGKQWNAVRRAMNDKFTTRELQDFFYSVWSTSAFKEQRRRAERKYDSVCRAKEAAKAKEKARKAAEKKKEEKEKRREEKERAKLEPSNNQGLPAIAEEAEGQGGKEGGGKESSPVNGKGANVNGHGTGEAMHVEEPGEGAGVKTETEPAVTPASVTTPAPTSDPASKELAFASGSGFAAKAEFKF